jgi:hypothetical protein
MTPQTSTRRVHDLMRALRAAHRRDSEEWTRRMEAQVDLGPRLRYP